MRSIGAAVLLGLGCALGCGRAPIDFSGPTAEWREYAGPDGLHHSPLTQIDARQRRRARAGLEPPQRRLPARATPSTRRRPSRSRRSSSNDTLYYCTAYMRVFALDPETGAERWVFDPGAARAAAGGPVSADVPRCRVLGGAAAAAPAPPCQRRILYGTRDSELIALDADTGVPCADFGANGRVALREGIGDAPPWEYYPTSPPLVMGDLAIARRAGRRPAARRRAVGRRARLRRAQRASCVWAWDPVPPGSRAERCAAGELYQRGTPNVWSLLSGDPERGLVFVPTGNPSPDSFGGLRDGIDYYGSSTVALDAKTGQVVWHFQTVHHDVWDYDVAAAADALPDRRRRRRASRRSRSRPRWATSSCSTARRARRSIRSRSGRCRRAACPARQLSPTQPFPTHPRAAASVRAQRRERVRLHADRPRLVSRADREAALGRHLHAADARGLDPVPAHRRRHELGRRRDRSRRAASCSRTRPTSRCR